MNDRDAFETAGNLRHQWRGTDPMHTEADVRRAIQATGEVAPEDVEAVLRHLVPGLVADGMLPPEERGEPEGEPWTTHTRAHLTGY